MNSIKVCEYSRSRSFHDDLILQDQASGERSQDQWSSGSTLPFLDHCLYTIVVGSAYFVKSTPPRAFSVSFKFFVDLFQIYFRCA